MFMIYFHLITIFSSNLNKHIYTSQKEKERCVTKQIMNTNKVINILQHSLNMDTIQLSKEVKAIIRTDLPLTSEVTFNEYAELFGKSIHAMVASTNYRFNLYDNRGYFTEYLFIKFYEYCIIKVKKYETSINYRLCDLQNDVEKNFLEIYINLYSSVNQPCEILKACYIKENVLHSKYLLNLLKNKKIIYSEYIYNEFLQTKYETYEVFDASQNKFIFFINILVETLVDNNMKDIFKGYNSRSLGLNYLIKTLSALILCDIKKRMVSKPSEGIYIFLLPTKIQFLRRACFGNIDVFRNFTLGNYVGLNYGNIYCHFLLLLAVPFYGGELII